MFYGHLVGELCADPRAPAAAACPSMPIASARSPGVTASPAGSGFAGEIPCSRRSITLLEVVETGTFPAEEVEDFAKALV